MSSGRTIITWTLYPGALLFSMLGYCQLKLMAPAWLAVSAPVLVVSLVLFALERRLPKTAAWRPSQQTWALDLLHSLVSTSGPPVLLRALFFGALYALGSRITPDGNTLWPHQWPLFAQAALALLIGEFGAYWVHRICHRWPFWWRIHARHHSPDKLHLLASGRNHPLNVLFSYSAQVAPLLLMGINADALALASVFTGVHGLLQHTNIDMRVGLLNWVLSSPELHHFHHSKDLEESNTNFGSNLIVWDVVFGTYFLPRDRRASSRVGMSELKLRENFWHHLALPFIYNKVVRAQAAAADATLPPAD